MSSSPSPYGLIGDIHAKLLAERQKIALSLASGTCKDNLTRYHELVGQCKGLEQAAQICTNVQSGDDK